jgi:hypothetical protein
MVWVYLKTGRAVVKRWITARRDFRCISVIWAKITSRSGSITVPFGSLYQKLGGYTRLLSPRT